MPFGQELLYEFLDLDVLGPAAQIVRALSATTETTTTALAPVPDAHVDLQWMGVGSQPKWLGDLRPPTPGKPPQDRSTTWRSSRRSQRTTPQRLPVSREELMNGSCSITSPLAN
jgi:hypothetical protein